MKSPLLPLVATLYAFEGASAVPTPSPALGTLGSDEVNSDSSVRTLSPTLDMVAALGRGTPTKTPTIKPTIPPTVEGFGTTSEGQFLLPGIDYDSVGGPEPTEEPTTQVPTYMPTDAPVVSAVIAGAEAQYNEGSSRAVGTVVAAVIAGGMMALAGLR